MTKTPIIAPKSFMGTCRDFFGLHAGQTGLQFGKEIQALTHADKVEIHEGLTLLGIECPAPVEARSVVAA